MSSSTHLFLVCTLLGFVVAGGVEAQVFRWTDSEGRVHYGDKPPDNAAAKQIQTPQGGAVAADKDVIVEETEMRYFEINGRTVADLNRGRETYGISMRSFRDGKPYMSWANCGWSANWKYLGGEGGQCRGGRYQVTLHTFITFPKWMDKADAPPELQSKWDTFTRVVMTHELGHKANDVRAANELAFELNRLPPAADCKALGEQAQAVFARVVAKYKLLNNAWDQAQVNGSEENYWLH